MFETFRTVLSLLLTQHVPPGYSKFSLEPALDCSPSAEYCEGAQFSEFYQNWMIKESAGTGQERYGEIANAYIDAAKEVLCVDIGEGCVPFGTRKKAQFNVFALSIAASSVSMYESGFREDVMVGRGRSGKPSSDGGEGRGPGNEGCLMQIHPTIAWQYADIPEDMRVAAKNGNQEAREAAVQSLLGGSPEQLRACARAGMRMLIRSREYCSWKAPKEDWDFAMYSMYGTGNSCTSVNQGKTTLRTNMFRRLMNQAHEACSKETKNKWCKERKKEG